MTDKSINPKLSPEVARLTNRLTELEVERQNVKIQLDRDRLTKATGSVIETITSPEFIDRMRAFREKATEGEVSYDEVGDMLSLESLRAAGADFPDDFRLTSRIFEDLESGLKIELKPPISLDRGGLVAWGACAGGGAATVCGCAGGST